MGLFPSPPNNQGYLAQVLGYHFDILHCVYLTSELLITPTTMGRVISTAKSIRGPKQDKENRPIQNTRTLRSSRPATLQVVKDVPSPPAASRSQASDDTLPTSAATPYDGVEADSSASLPPADSTGSYAGFPSTEQFDQIVSTYLEAHSHRRRTKALVDQKLYDLIFACLANPGDRDLADSQFRFWAKRCFKLTKDKVTNHHGKLVATKEQLYGILVRFHGECDHGGRDKTTALIKQHYSGVCKTLVNDFIKRCPTCTSHGMRKGRKNASALQAPVEVTLVHRGPQSSTAFTQEGSVKPRPTVNPTEPPEPQVTSKPWTEATIAMTPPAYPPPQHPPPYLSSYSYGGPYSPYSSGTESKEPQWHLPEPSTSTATRPSRMSILPQMPLMTTQPLFSSLAGTSTPELSFSAAASPFTTYASTPDASGDVSQSMPDIGEIMAAQQLRNTAGDDRRLVGLGLVYDDGSQLVMDQVLFLPDSAVPTMTLKQ